ncbi:hypothetical protein KL86PLE_90089 [uncultured Pleomorphomonas sp.]|uniref:Uncharacterized protein n=1 Tax=uncultured Pleomorphomonas sp. TaxID=442121 RepID=A0A212LMQ6_9HYPH|nr:hypothetical protein KL86PLE_90089 [uncultured Pleomorphomonas sp.]
MIVSESPPGSAGAIGRSLACARR